MNRLRHTLRSLVRTPLFTVVTILTLAIGIGANTAIFSVVYAILMKPLPFEQPERLVGVWHTAPAVGMPKLPQSPSSYFTYRDEKRAFEDIGVWDDEQVAVTGRGDPERVHALVFTDAVLSLLRVQPVLGRRFSPRDDLPGSARTVLLTYGYWQSKFGGSPNAVGQSLIVDGRPYQVIGVLPQAFRFLDTQPSLVLPFQMNRSEVRVGNFGFRGIARLKPGVTLAQANADVARMIPMTLDKFPMPGAFTRKMFEEIRLGADVHPLADDVVGDIGKVLWIIFGTVAMVLLIACANVANLFLVRAEGRQQELAVRAALGASRGRVAKELLAESMGLSVVGGLAGVGLAWAGIRLLVTIAPQGLPRLNEIAIDPIVLLFTLVLSLLSGLLFGLIPVFRFASGRLASALKEGGRASSDGRERHRARSVLVVAEVALALVLLVGSGLMIRTFQAMRRVDPGFRSPEQVLTFRIAVPEAVAASPDDVARTFERIAAKLEQLPAVERVGASSSIAMDGNGNANPVFVEDFPGVAGKMPPLRHFKWVGGNYCEAMGTRLVAGRTITWDDIARLKPVAVVSENLAREYWKTPSAALGRRVRTAPSDAWREIVGVVGDVRERGAAQPPAFTLYLPMRMTQFFGGDFVARSLTFVVRSRARVGSPAFLKEAQQAVWSVNGSLPLANIKTLGRVQAESMAHTSFALVMLAIAAAVALLLGIVGIYGVIAYIAAQRTREIGIRVALGAQPAHVSGMFVRHGLVLSGVGLAVGLVAAAVLTRLMSSLLFGVSALDPLTFGSVSLVLVVIALVASYLPARRAARVDPVIALRAQM